MTEGRYNRVEQKTNQKNVNPDSYDFRKDNYRRELYQRQKSFHFFLLMAEVGNGGIGIQ